MTSLGEAEMGDLRVGREDEKDSSSKYRHTSVSRMVWQP